MYQAVIFDLDGTILNTLDDLADSANHVLAARGYPTHPTERYKTFVGNGIPKLIERMLPPDLPSREYESMLREFQGYYGLHKEDKTAPYEGIPALLADLKAQGRQCCVLSNKQHDLSVQIVTHYFGPDAFRIIQGQSDRFPVKPDPASCLDMISRLGLRPQEILYVGDSNVDMQTAANAGLTKCGVSWGFRSVEELTEAGADFIAKRPQDIVDIALGKETVRQ